MREKFQKAPAAASIKTNRSIRFILNNKDVFKIITLEKKNVEHWARLVKYSLYKKKHWDLI